MVVLVVIVILVVVVLVEVVVVGCNVVVVLLVVVVVIIVVLVVVVELVVVVVVVVLLLVVVVLVEVVVVGCDVVVVLVVVGVGEGVGADEESSKKVSSKLATLIPEVPLGFSMLQINLTYFVFSGAESEVTEYWTQSLLAAVIPELFFVASTLRELFKNSILTFAVEPSTQLCPEGVLIHELPEYT